MIEILSYKEVGKGALKAEVNVKISTAFGLQTINKILIFNKDNKRWVTLPSEIYKKGDETRYFQLVRFEGYKFHEALLKKLDELAPAIAAGHFKKQDKDEFNF